MPRVPAGWACPLSSPGRWTTRSQPVERSTGSGDDGGTTGSAAVDERLLSPGPGCRPARCPPVVHTLGRSGDLRRQGVTHSMHSRYDDDYLDHRMRSHRARAGPRRRPAAGSAGHTRTSKRLEAQRRHAPTGEHDASPPTVRPGVGCVTRGHYCRPRDGRTVRPAGSAWRRVVVGRAAAAESPAGEVGDRAFGHRPGAG